MAIFIRIAVADPLAGPDAMELAVVFAGGLGRTSGPALRVADVPDKIVVPPAL